MICLSTMSFFPLNFSRYMVLITSVYGVHVNRGYTCMENTVQNFSLIYLSTQLLIFILMKILKNYQPKMSILDTNKTCFISFENNHKYPSTSWKKTTWKETRVGTNIFLSFSGSLQANSVDQEREKSKTFWAFFYTRADAPFLFCRTDDH